MCSNSTVLIFVIRTISIIWTRIRTPVAKGVRIIEVLLYYMCVSCAIHVIWCTGGGRWSTNGHMFYMCVSCAIHVIWCTGGGRWSINGHMYYMYVCHVLYMWYDVQVVVDEDPHYVVRRFEGGRFAVDSQVRQVYQRALTMTEVPHTITYMLLSAFCVINLLFLICRRKLIY